MASIEQFFIFLTAAILLNVSPGADHVYIVSRTVAHGRFAGFLSSWGVCTGAMVHVIAAAFGISAVIAASQTAFAVVKLLGAGYLCWLGLQALRSRGMSLNVDASGLEKVSWWHTFRQGVIVDVLNPKVTVFFIAFLPQFVDPSLGAAWWQMIILGSIIIVIALVWEAVLVLGTGTISNFLREQSAVGKWLDRAMGVTLIALGVSLARSASSN